VIGFITGGHSMRWSFFRPVVRSLSVSASRPARRRALRGPLDVLEDRSVPSVMPLTLPRPVAHDDWADTDGTNPVSVAVLTTDTPAPTRPGGPAAQLLPDTVRLAARPAHGNVTIDRTNGTITYTAAANFIGSDRFRYTVRDADGITARPAIVTIQVN